MDDEWAPTLAERVTTPLLSRITAESLDEDYRQVALRRASTEAQPPSGKPQWIAMSVVVVFGLLVTTAAMQTSRNADVTDAGRATLIAQVEEERADVAALQDRITALQDEGIELEAQLEAVTADQREALTRLRRLQVRTGFIAVQGEGVRIVVDDAPNGDAVELVTSNDLAILVDGLWNAGAEAIAVNGQRLTVLTSFSNTGPAVHVNTRPVNAPYTVQAIGDTATLQANLLDTSHGQQFFDVAEQLGFPYTMQNEEVLSLPAAKWRPLRLVKEGTAADNRGPREGANP